MGLSRGPLTFTNPNTAVNCADGIAELPPHLQVTKCHHVGSMYDSVPHKKDFVRRAL